MAIEIEEGWYCFRCSFFLEDGSLSVEYPTNYVKNSNHMKDVIENLKGHLKDAYGAKEPFNITYKESY